jgi:hypothetical protein
MDYTVNNEINYFNDSKTIYFNDSKTIYLIGLFTGGGVNKYLNDIISNYKNTKFINFCNKEHLYSFNYLKKDILFITNLFNSDIDIQDILNIKNKFNCKIIIPIHDFYWINNKIQRNLSNKLVEWHYNYLTEIVVNSQIIELFNSADIIIHPSKFTFNIYSKYFNNTNFKLVIHNDIKLIDNIYIPKITDTINIGVLHHNNIHKGSAFIDYLKTKYINYKNYNINYVIVGVNVENYDENNFNDFVKNKNIHCSTLLTKVGETHCYLLSKILNTGLPLIYNNFGSFKERINEKKENMFKVYENEIDIYCDFEYIKLCLKFELMLDYIILNNGKFNEITCDNTIIYNSFYNDLFM